MSGNVGGVLRQREYQQYAEEHSQLCFVHDKGYWARQFTDRLRSVLT